MSDLDVLVVGAGHAGCEAALATSRMGLRTAVMVLRRDRIAFMPCNPAIGGLGKGHLVREIDALGGQMGRAIDAAGIQFRMLNRSKGPAVWSPRAQADKALYSRVMQRVLEAQPNLQILEASAEALIVDVQAGGRRRRIRGVRDARGTEHLARAVILTTGTFLRGLMHMGEDQQAGGRNGEPASMGMSDSLRELGFPLGRLKTGTPPRLLRDSIDFSRFEIQLGDDPPRPFSHTTENLSVDQVPCYLAHTTETVHELIRSNLHRAPMYNGQVKSRGPRYCPSIEDKVVRFAERGSHHLFLEPEGRTSQEIYVNGLSTSLPRDVQREVVRLVPGLEQAEFVRFGYAVEYDFLPSGQVTETLEARSVAGLYFAGQINGTSGYEEAAAQGLMAGINAGAQLLGQEPLVLRRSEAYVGVLLDDLARTELLEPYRMFTSRAEFRLQLRSDNADERLMRYAERYGLMDEPLRSVRDRSAAQLVQLMGLRQQILGAERVRDIAEKCDVSAGAGAASVEKLIRVPGIRATDVITALLGVGASTFHPDVIEKFEVRVRYEGYIRRQDRDIAQVERLESRTIPPQLDYAAISGLSHEAREKLARLRPRSIAQAARIDGVRAADVSLLVVHVERSRRVDAADPAAAGTDA
jgi:tRNA uridine 5-carboxymethylaminomethyl modification enzyme